MPRDRFVFVLIGFVISAVVLRVAFMPREFMVVPGDTLVQPETKAVNQRPPSTTAAATTAKPTTGTSADLHHSETDPQVDSVQPEKKASSDEAPVPSEDSRGGSTVNVVGGGDGSGSGGGDTTPGAMGRMAANDPLEEFVQDPSFKTRCHAHTVPPLIHCPKRTEFRFADRRPYTLMGPSYGGSGAKGATTKGMTVQTMDELTGKTGMVHHPIFQEYAARTWNAGWLPQRVVEFVGIHTDYNYDCPEDIDFRQYHQVRTAMCLQYEATEANLKANGTVEQFGMYPLVDEEYYEYMMTLTTAWDAAKRNENYTFIELGSRYGTWIVRAGAAFRQFAPSQRQRLALLAVEGSCEWFQKMKEHVQCNNFGDDTDLILAYAGPKSYNQVDAKKPDTYGKPRAVSMLQMLPRYNFVNMIDFDIQGFEHFTVEEPGVFEMLTEKVGFLHFGTHGTDIEKRLLTLFQKSDDWCVVYFFAGAHTKKLHKGHRCTTPYGPSGFNDGVLGIANTRFYSQLAGGKCKRIPSGPTKTVAKTCYSIPEMKDNFLRSEQQQRRL